MTTGVTEIPRAVDHAGAVSTSPPTTANDAHEAEVAASRRRIVTASDEARRRIERCGSCGTVMDGACLSYGDYPRTVYRCAQRPRGCGWVSINMNLLEDEVGHRVVSAIQDGALRAAKVDAELYDMDNLMTEISVEFERREELGDPTWTATSPEANSTARPSGATSASALPRTVASTTTGRSRCPTGRVARRRVGTSSAWVGSAR